MARKRHPTGLEQYLAIPAIDHARREYVIGWMTLAEFETVAENYLRGHPHCPACGRFPVDGYGLCQRHTV